MASILESLAQQMNPELLGSIAKAAGVDPALVQQGLQIAGPLVQGSLARQSETTAGMDQIMQLINNVSSEGMPSTAGDIMGSLAGLVGGFSKGAGGEIASAGAMNELFGQGASAAGKVLSSKLGFDVTPLLSAALPALVGAVAGMAKEQKFDSAGIANLLQTQQKETLAAITPEVAAVLNEVDDAVGKANAIKDSFTAEEWASIRLAPTATALYVITASPSGIIGSMKELTAAGDAMREMLSTASATSLVNVAFGNAFGAVEGELKLTEESPRAAILEALQVASTAVKAKTSAEASGFADTLNGLAQKVATASKEGGFLGIGAKVISAEEQKALDEIEATLA